MKPTRRQRKLAHFAWARRRARELKSIREFWTNIDAHNAKILIGFDPAFDGVGVIAKFTNTADGQTCTIHAASP